jgi:hypothetical protein
MIKRCIKKFFVYFFTAGILLIFPVRPGYSQYTGIYQHFLEKAQESIRKEDYRSALLYLETAQTVQPESPDVLHYLNVVKHALQQRIQQVEPVVKTPEVKASPSVQSLSISSAEQKKITTVPPIPPVSAESVQLQQGKPVSVPDLKKTITATQGAVPSPKIYPVVSVEASPPLREVVISDETLDRQRIVFELNDEAWNSQPDMEIELGLDQEILIRGINIERYLVIAPDVLDVARQANKEVLITPKIYGQTFVHIWDAQRRWTFYIKTVFPTQRAAAIAQAAVSRERHVDSFRFSYNADWNSFYQGQSKDDLNRQSYNMRNRLGLTGPSPYGNWDSYAIFLKTYQENTDLTDYSVGLTGAKWKDVKDIHVRIFDASRYLSNLTMPGRDFHGALISGTSVDEQFSLTALRGRDRATFGLLSSKDNDRRDSYVEAGKFSYKPNDKHKVSVNYAHAWGEDKQPTATSNVYSVEFDQRLENWHLYSEAAYNQDEAAQIVWSKHKFEEGNLFIKARNVPPDYATIVGATGNQGEVGTEFSLSHQMGQTDLTHYLDIYRDRDNKNPSDEGAVNFDFHSNISRRLTDRNSVSGSFYVIHSPGTLADQTDFRILGTFNRRLNVFQFSNAMLSWTGSYQHSRSDAFPSGDYDRTGLITNFYLPLNRLFNYNASYELYYVEDVATDEVSYPRAFNTGISYSQIFFEKWRLNAQVYYRDEEKTEAEKSFMAGQDSLAVSSGLDFSPRSGMDVYLDGRVREIWAENNRASAYVEADIRLGLRSDWDLGWAWNPKGIVQGYVFRDLNNNGIKEDNEFGIPGVRVRVGEGEAKTDKTGWYYKEVRAKSVQVNLDIDTIPKGYIFTDSSDKVFDVEHNHFYDGSFALTTQSGIYGVVYHDQNNNGRPDNGDEFLYKIRLVLNGEKQAETDSKGTYFFYNIAEGTHKLSLDLNSLPVQYLPKIPLVNDIFVADGAMYIFHIPVVKK